MASNTRDAPGEVPHALEPLQPLVREWELEASAGGQRLAGGRSTFR